MKIVDKMKDEELGLALIYNFTKGYGKPVPIELYDIVLPFLYHDDFREMILNYHTLYECIQACQVNDNHFGRIIIEDIESYKTMTSKVLGMSIIQRTLSFKIINQTMSGVLESSSIIDLNEAICLGEMVQSLDIDMIINQLQETTKKIVVLQSESVGIDVDLSSLESLGQVTFYPQVKQKDVRELIKDAHIVITNKNLLTKNELEGLDQLELICLFATGTNNVDLEYCKEKGIKVSNVKGYSTDTVAQHTLSLLMHLLEKNQQYDHYVKSKEYTSCSSFSFFNYVFHDISSMTWGIVGLGDIGKKVASIASAMGANVQYYSTSGHNASHEYQQVDFTTLLKTSDIITIHAPLNDQTKYLFNETALKQMKRDAYLINVGRGGIIEERDLVNVLNNGYLAGVGLDVFEHEPLQEDDIIYSIQDMNKVILTPHIAWASIEARQRLVNEVYENIMAFLKNEERNVVNK